MRLQIYLFSANWASSSAGIGTIIVVVDTIIICCCCCCYCCRQRSKRKHDQNASGTPAEITGLQDLDPGTSPHSPSTAEALQPVEHETTLHSPGTVGVDGVCAVSTQHAPLNINIQLPTVLQAFYDDTPNECAQIHSYLPAALPPAYDAVYSAPPPSYSEAVQDDNGRVDLSLPLLLQTGATTELS